MNTQKTPIITTTGTKGRTSSVTCYAIGAVHSEPVLGVDTNRLPRVGLSQSDITMIACTLDPEYGTDRTIRSCISLAEPAAATNSRIKF